ncbi:hypothetical protein H8E52_02395 [bacterium]|nr:hypothetical protein [bacterium]
MKVLLSIFSILVALATTTLAEPIPIFSDEPITLNCNDDPRGVDVGDINGDEIMDIVVVNTAIDAYTILLGNNAGSYEYGGMFDPFDEEPRDVALADLQGLGRMDMVIPCTGDIDWGYTQIFHNTGWGYSIHQSLYGGRGPWHCVVDEFDGSPGLDVVLTYPRCGANLSVERNSRNPSQ